MGIRSGGNGFYEPDGFRKYPGGVFSRNLADLKNIPVECFSARLWLALPTKPENLRSDGTAKGSQAMNGERKVFARLRTRFFYFLVETRVGHRVSKGDFVSCGTRLRALP